MSKDPVKTNVTEQDVLKAMIGGAERKAPEINNETLFNYAHSFGLCLTYGETGYLLKHNVPEDAMFIIRKFREYLDANNHSGKSTIVKRKLWFKMRSLGRLTISYCRDYTPGRLKNEQY